MGLVVLFDLDGTLSDPLPGILSSYRLAFSELGLGPPPEVPPAALVGPPLADVLPSLGVEAAAVPAALAAYRRHYKATGYAENTLYDGVIDMLDAVAAAGARLGVATSKNENAAWLVLEHHGIAGRFDAVAGASEDDSVRHKHQVVTLALDRLGWQADGDRAVLVGDRRHDVEGATTAGIACLGVLWGFGTEEELRDAGATMLATAPHQVAGILMAGPAGGASGSDPPAPRPGP